MGADAFAGVAGEAGGGLLVGGQGLEGHWGDEAAAGEGVLVVEFEKVWDVQALRAMAGAVAATGAGKNAREHAVGDGEKRFGFGC